MQRKNVVRLAIAGAGAGLVAATAVAAAITGQGLTTGSSAVEVAPVQVGGVTGSAAVPTSCRVPGAVAVARRGAANGGAVALSAAEDRAAVVDTDNNAVAVLAVDAAGARPYTHVATGAGPAQAVFGADGRLFVTERRANAVAVYDGQTGRLLCRTRVAADPVGLALSPDEQHVYVTSGMARTLTVLDGDTLQPRHAVAIAREPRGVAVTPDGTRVLIAHVAGAPLSVVDVARGAPFARTLPALPVPVERAGGTMVTPVPSQAYAVVVDASANEALVPLIVNRTGREVPQEARLERYGGGSVNEESEKVSFVLARLDLRTERWTAVARPTPVVLPSAAQGRGTMIGMVPAVPLTGRVRIPAAAALRTTDHALLVASMGTNEVATFSLDPSASETAAAAPRFNRASEEGLPFGFRRGPRGVALPTSVPAVPPVAAAPTADATVATPSGVAVLSTGEVLVFSPSEHAVEFRRGARRERIVVGSEALPRDVARGRRLFLAANDARISTGGLSCGGCHPDGHDDGLVWFLAPGPRQTPTLAGRVTAPFGWNGTQRTLEGNIAQTIQRLGGTGLSMADVDALAAYVSRGLAAPERDAVAPTAQVARGQQLFAREAGCATCHDPVRNFTDGQPHELGGLRPDETAREFDTPSLRFVGATGPYFHDGRYATLRDMLHDPTHRMGHAHTLSHDDAEALEAYLETL